MAKRYHSGLVRENMSADSNLPTDRSVDVLDKNESAMTGVNDLYGAIQEQIKGDNRDLGSLKTNRKY